MADRILRDEILDSDRWLDLPADTHRLVYVGLLLHADDFGNFEGGIRRLFRFMNHFTQVKTEEAAATVMGHLVDADMARGYKAMVDGVEREFYHLPRFQSHRQYLTRKCPPSPWDDVERVLGKTKRKLIVNQGLAKIVATTSQQDSSHVLQGVGVGVGVELKPLVRSPNGDARFVTFWKAYPRKVRKQDASKAWSKLNPDDALQATIMAALAVQKSSPQWTRDHGQFIPHAATWLNGRRWEDEPEVAKSAADTKLEKQRQAII
jgi:hypothetical protein